MPAAVKGAAGREATETQRNSRPRTRETGGHYGHVKDIGPAWKNDVFAVYGQGGVCGGCWQQLVALIDDRQIFHKNFSDAVVEVGSQRDGGVHATPAVAIMLVPVNMASGQALVAVRAPLA